MPNPSYCPNPDCEYHTEPPRNWTVRYGSYSTRAHGRVQRFRCRACGRTVSTQTESVHYYAKRRVPLRAIWTSLVGGASMREVARRYRISPVTMQNAVLRLGRQAMAAHVNLLGEVPGRKNVIFDGLRSFVTSQDHPCDLTTVVDRTGEVILTMTHTVTGRGGKKTPKQQVRIAEKSVVWKPKPGTMTNDISLLVGEIWDYLRPTAHLPAVIDTDEHRLYRSVLARDPVMQHYRLLPVIRHIRTPSTAPRTYDNRLFPVNYVDRLLRHRLKEHTRETIAFGRHSTMQMHRAWIFAYDHNCRREYRVKKPEFGVHAEQGTIASGQARRYNRSFFVRRIRVEAELLPKTISRVWLNQLPTPPVRWRAGQQGTSIRIPQYARRDLGPVV